jgi:hypothetical protein
MKRSWACAPLSCSDPLQLGPSALYETLVRVQKDDTPKARARRPGQAGARPSPGKSLGNLKTNDRVPHNAFKAGSSRSNSRLTTP